MGHGNSKWFFDMGLVIMIDSKILSNSTYL